MSTTSAERLNFSSRLIRTLASARGLDASPTTLAREFNHAFQGRPVTVHAARKWLLGEAIPTQEKMQVLARWLGVSAEWLRFGGDEAVEGSTSGSTVGKRPVSNMDGFLQLYLTLPQRERAMARDFIAMLGKQPRPVSARASPQREQLSQP